MQLSPSYDSQFTILFHFANGYVRRHIAVDVNAVDYKDVETIAIEKAMQGMQVDIMPTLQDDDTLRAVIFPDAIGFKSPDLRIDGVLWEVENSTRSENFNNIKHAIDRGREQADFVIVNLSCKISNRTMHRLIVGRFKDHTNLKIIEFRYKGEYTTFYK